MYKVFFNDRIVLITDSVSETITSSEALIFFNPSTQVVVDELEKFLLSDNIYDIQFVHDNVPALYATFCAFFKCIDAAGGVVFNGSNEMLAIYRLGRWDLPKGKVEKGESIQFAALREVEEECGISGMKIMRQLPSTFHIYRSPYKPKQWVLKQTYWFEMFYDGSAMLMPQTEESILEARWIQKNRIETIYNDTYSSLKEVIREYMD